MAYARCTRNEETFRGKLIESNELFFFHFPMHHMRASERENMPGHNRTWETMKRLFHARDETSGISAVTPCSLYQPERDSRCTAFYAIDVQFELCNDSRDREKALFGFEAKANDAVRDKR